MRKPVTLTMDEAMITWIRELSPRQRSLIVEQMLEHARTHIVHIDVRGHVTFTDHQDTDVPTKERRP